MKKISKYPIDFDAIHKGDSIPASQVQEICGHHIGSPKYSFAALNLCKQIMDYKKKHGEPVTVILKDYGIRVLTDSEAVVYNKTDFDRRISGMFRAHNRQRNVDSNELSEEEKKSWERSIIVQSHIIQSVQTAKKQLRIELHKRNTPGLLEINGEKRSVNESTGL